MRSLCEAFKPRQHGRIGPLETDGHKKIEVASVRFSMGDAVDGPCKKEKRSLEVLMFKVSKSLSSVFV